MKVGVLCHPPKLNSRPQRYISKNAAAALVRRLLAVQITKHLIQMVEPRQGGLPARAHCRLEAPAEYQHHIEPRLERLTIASSPYLAYLEGYATREM